MLPVETHLKTTVGKLGGQTIGTNSSDQRHHILNRFSVSAGHVVRLQPGGLPAVCWEVSVGSTGWPLPCSLAAYWRVCSSGCRGFPQRQAEGGGWAGAGARAGPAGTRKRHFSLGWCSWSRPWPQESSGPAWLRLQRWVVLEDPSGGGQVGTWQHSQDWAGLGGSARAPHTARSSGWASAELPGCLGWQEGAWRRQGRVTLLCSQREHGDLPCAPSVREAPKALFQPSGTCGAALTLLPDRNGAMSAPGTAVPRGTGSGRRAHTGSLTLEPQPPRALQHELRPPLE